MAYRVTESDVGPDEWQARCDLAAFYRLLAHFRMTDVIDTHISSRVPGARDLFFINRYGVLFEHMRASDLVKVNFDGEIADEHADSDAVNKAGLNIHAAIHAAREDVGCVVHTHTSAGIAVSAQEEGLLPISQHALKFYGRLSYHDYEGIALDKAERARLVRDLGPHMAMILRNHGLLAVGKTVAEAFNQIYFLERACQAQVQAQSSVRSLRFPPPDVCELTANQSADEIDQGLHLVAWKAVLLLVDDLRPDYRS